MVVRVELIARKETGRVTGWLGYGLMWADRQFAEINDGKRYPAKFDNRHKLNVVANWKLSDKVELTGSWTFMTGNRLTASFRKLRRPRTGTFSIRRSSYSSVYEYTGRT